MKDEDTRKPNPVAGPVCAGCGFMAGGAITLAKLASIDYDHWDYVDVWMLWPLVLPLVLGLPMTIFALTQWNVGLSLRLGAFSVGAGGLCMLGAFTHSIADRFEIIWLIGAPLLMGVLAARFAGSRVGRSEVLG